MWDVGGQKRLRDMWRYYYENTQAVIYVVDSCDVERMDQEAKEELHVLMNADELKDCQFLIYANKQDAVGALSPPQVTEKLGLHQITNRTWQVQGSSAIRGDGLYEGLDWVSNQISKNQHLYKK